MSNFEHAADRLVLQAVSPTNSRAASCLFTGAEGRRQELPTLDLLGAAIARASRIAAARERALAPALRIAGSQAAGFLKPSQGEMEALFADHALQEGRPLLPTPATGGRIWRLHAAPSEAGPAVAWDKASDARNAGRSRPEPDADGYLGAGA